MAITSNNPLSVVTEATFATLPQADVEPLLTTLENANGMYVSHAPAMLSALYTVEKAISATRISGPATFEIPIVPSADGLDYDFSHWIYAEAGGAGTITVTTDEWYGAAWHNIRTTAGIAAAASTMIRHDHTDAINKDSTILRVVISRATNPYTPCSILVRPGTNAVTSGIKASGFRPFDDGMLNVGTNDGGINTEHINRCKQNAMAIYKDRQQCVFSFVQENGLTNPRYFATDSPYADDTWAAFGEAVAIMPGQRDPTLTIYAIGTTDSVLKTDQIRVVQTGGEAEDLDADGTVDSAELNTTLLSPGEINARLAIGIFGKYVIAKTMAINAVVVMWRPGD
jgi:hypothetical protein